MNVQVIKALTLDDVRKAIPSRKNAITQEIVDMFNDSMTEAEFQGESLIQTAITYESVLQGRSGVGMKDYINALKFCAYLITTDDNYTEAYKKTFYHRDFVKERIGKSTESVEYRELTTAASRYRRSKLVVDILTVSQVPLDMMFTGARYRAIAVLADRMENAKLDRDKINAAKELLAATKGPENMKIALDVGVQENSAVENLTVQLAAMAAKQKILLEAGATTLGELGAMRVVSDGIATEGEYDE